MVSSRGKPNREISLRRPGSRLCALFDANSVPSVPRVIIAAQFESQTFKWADYIIRPAYLYAGFIYRGEEGELGKKEIRASPIMTNILSGL